MNSWHPWQLKTKHIKTLDLWMKNWKVRVWCSLFHFFMWFARFQILICKPQSITQKLLVLSWLYNDFDHTFIFKSYHWNNISFLVLLTVLIVSTQERKVPKFLQKLNKALGLPKKSEVVWEILTIANNTNKIANLKERVDQLEECCNFTKSRKSILLLKSEKSLKVIFVRPNWAELVKEAGMLTSHWLLRLQS